MTTKRAAITLTYAAVVVQLAAYVARDAGLFTTGPLYSTVLYASSLTLLCAVVWLASMRERFEGSQSSSHRAMEKVFAAIAAISVLALVAVQIVRATGHLRDQSLYLTLNIMLVVLFLAMSYQAYLKRKGADSSR